MIKAKVVSSLFLVFLIGCSSINSSDRSSVINWAKQIASLDKRLENEIAQAQPLMRKITSRPPTRSEVDELTGYSNNVTSLYNEIINIEPPSEAKSVHGKYVDSYAKSADYLRYYVIAIKQNDLSYFDKSVIAAQEANRIGEQAHIALEDLLNRYSISCKEINFCE